ncbi:MAG TPA: four helix bundle protein, partial [Longimicrobiales bacterium]|nr:four helix bundle protein [Longimicrobiales bacterium]
MGRRYRFRFKGLDVYQAAVEHFTWVAEVVGRRPKGPFVVTNQVLGASLSIVGNIGEANGRYVWGHTALPGCDFEAFTGCRDTDILEVPEQAEALEAFKRWTLETGR